MFQIFRPLPFLLLLLIDSPERTLVSAHRERELNLNVLDRVGSALHVLLVGTRNQSSSSLLASLTMANC